MEYGFIKNVRKICQVVCVLSIFGRNFSSKIVFKL